MVSMHLQELCPNHIGELSIPSSSTCIKWYWVLCFSLQLCFISNVYSVSNFWRTGNQNTDSWSDETDKNLASKPTVYKKAALSQGNFVRCRCNFPRWRPAAILDLIEPEIRPRKPYSRTKHKVDRWSVAKMAIWNSTYQEGCTRDPIFREGKVVEGHRWYHWKEQWRFPV